jgi:hypothetical protein
MNERIKELLAKALDNETIIASKSFGHWPLYDEDLEKFAELIVKECMDIISNQTTLDTNEDFREGFSHGCKLSWTDIRKHFGD